MFKKILERLFLPKPGVVYWNEEAIIDDLVKKIKADPEAVKRWRDPASWRMPIDADGKFEEDAPEHAGCLMFFGMTIRNHYKLWDANNPHTKIDNLEITNGIITDPKHPDNVSGRIIHRVKKEIC